MTRHDDAYDRLLRWYPKAWRDAHGAVFLDTLRAQSEHEGRSGPSRSESLAAMMTGLGTRMDAQLAGRLGLGAIALTALFRTLVDVFPVGAAELSDLAVFNVAAITFIGAIAILAFAGGVSLARVGGLLSAQRSPAVLVVGSLGLALGAATAFVWVYPNGPSESSPAPETFALAGAALTLGISAGWLCFESVLSKTRLGMLPGAGLAALLAIAVTPIALGAVIMDRAWTVFAVWVVALFLRKLPSGGPRESGASLEVQSQPPHHHRLHVWGPLTMLGLVLVSMPIHTTAIDLARWMALGSALAWWIVARLHAPLSDRVVASTAILLIPLALQNALVAQVAGISALLLVASGLHVRRRAARTPSAPVAGD